MKTLFITHHYLSSNGGGSFASRAYINAFAQLSNEMTLLYPVAHGEDVFDGINQKVKLVPVDNAIPIWEKVLNLLVGRVHRYFVVAPEYICSGCFDTVVFDTSIVSYRLIAIAKKAGLRTIVIHHNYQYEYFRDNTSGLLKPVTLLWCRRYEGQAIRNADINITLTQDDVVLLKEHYGTPSVDNFHILGTFEYVSRPRRTFSTVNTSLSRFAITGNLSSMQTEQSIVPWLKDYYPVFKEVFPEASLVIAGYKPGERITTLCSLLGIKLIPSPQSLDPILETADAYLCPTCLGGGLKLRVMDGLRWGLPVVSHAVSARGYENFKRHGFLWSYNDQQSFREALTQLAGRSFSKQEIGDAFNRIFAFESGVDRLKKILSL